MYIFSLRISTDFYETYDVFNKEQYLCGELLLPEKKLLTNF